jgi:hypothetical protein
MEKGIPANSGWELIEARDINIFDKGLMPAASQKDRKLGF